GVGYGGSIRSAGCARGRGGLGMPGSVSCPVRTGGSSPDAAPPLGEGDRGERVTGLGDASCVGRRAVFLLEGSGAAGIGSASCLGRRPVGLSRAGSGGWPDGIGIAPGGIGVAPGGGAGRG